MFLLPGRERSPTRPGRPRRRPPGWTWPRPSSGRENAFVGVASGLLDQFTVLFGRAGHASRSTAGAWPSSGCRWDDPAPAIVVCDSKTSRRLADGMYNRRRAECERVVTHFQQLRGAEHVRWLRDVTLDDLDAAWDDLDPVGRRRARHVLTENERVRQGAEAPAVGRPGSLRPA